MTWALEISRISIVAFGNTTAPRRGMSETRPQNRKCADKSGERSIHTSYLTAPVRFSPSRDHSCPSCTRSIRLGLTPGCRIGGADMAMTYDTTAVAAAQLRQVNEQSPAGNATQVDNAPLTIFELIMMALHE